MRYTDINLTMSLYTHVLKGQEYQAVSNLQAYRPRAARLRERPELTTWGLAYSLSTEMLGRPKPISRTKTSFSEQESPPQFEFLTHAFIISIFQSNLRHGSNSPDFGKHCFEAP